MGNGAVGARCTACGVELPERAKFCPECATPVHRAVDQVSGERRQATVLFADLVDSTLTSQQVDAEDFAAAVLAYQEMGRRAIVEVEGHLANYLGDGLLGVFGYPRIHEDDALRAIRAALRLLDGLEELRRQFPTVPLAARVGIHSGLIVVGEMGSAERSDTSVFGDTPNIAARVEGFAAAGTVAISQATFELVERYVTAEDLGRHELKGVIEPLGIHRVHNLLTGEVDQRRRLPFVGRRDDLDRLLALWADVQAGGSHSIFVRGEAGIGKSRLVREFYERLDVADVNRLRGTCSPVSSNTAYQPFVTVLERFAGVGPTSAPAIREKGLLDLIERWELHDTALHALLGLDRPGAGPPPSPERIRYATQAALREMLRRVLELGPTVLFIDDLHWADPSTRELLDRVVADSIPGLLVLSTLRPEIEIPTTGSAVVIDLPALTADEARRLARSAGADGIDDERLATIIERSGGIPLFVEELVRAVATGNDGSVPATLHDSLMARLDRLGSARPVAQVASVLGRDFSRGLLRAIVPTADVDAELAVLTEANLVAPVPGVSETFSFRHALIQDAAYESMLRRERRRLHARVAEVLQGIDHDARPEQIAHHLGRAGNLLEAARWAHRAGRRSASQGAYREALGHFRNGLAWLADEPDSTERDQVELQLQLMIGNSAQSVEGFATPANEPVWHRARELAERLGDLDETTSAMNGLFVMHFDRGECAQGRELAREIVRLAEAGGSRAGLVRGHGSAALASLYLGEPRLCLEHARSSIREYRPSDFHDITYGIGTDQGVVAHGAWGAAAWFLGLDGEALEHLEEAVNLGRHLDSMISTSIGLMFANVVHLWRRDYERVAELADELIHLATTLDSVQPLRFGRMARDAACAHLGSTDGIEASVAATEQLFAAPGGQGGAPLVMAVLADTYLTIGDATTALGLADLGLAVSGASGERFVDPELHCLRAAALQHEGADPGASDAAVEAARSSADAADAFSMRLRVELRIAERRRAAGLDIDTTRLAGIVGDAPAEADSLDLAAARTLLDHHPGAHV